ncbi:MAG TPA: hypothetical protein VM370_03035 [Candidatus Thermoplasmatota archaeon]|nr:hypothetical protein [Candidatus Thermoplasmatota archaeon]
MAKNLQTVARRALTPCAASDAFRFADGASVRDLNDFRHAIASKSASLVHFHKDQYGPWLHGILGDPALARKVERVGQRRSLDNPSYQNELLAILDERLGKLRTRVL